MRPSIVPRTAVLASLLLAGCVSLNRESPVQTRFLLDVVRGDAPTGPEHGVLLVRRFHSSTVASGRAFVYRRGPHEVDVDFYNELLVPPATAIEDAAAQWLGASGLFARIERPGTRQDIDHVLEGDLLGWWGVLGDGDTPPESFVELTLTLLDGTEHTVLWRHTFSVSVPVTAREPEAFVAGWNEAVSRILAEAETDLRDVLRPGPAPAADVR